MVTSQVESLLSESGESTAVVPEAPATLDLTVSEHEGETVITAAGELDVNTAPELREQLARLITGGANHVAIDLASVSFVDSTALSVLVSALKRLRQADGDLQLASPTPSVRRVFEITGLTRLFTIR
jgi:anti-sigma B factor antagonist